MMTFGWLLALAPFLLGRKQARPVVKDWNKMTDAERKQVIQNWEKSVDELRPAARKGKLT